MVQSSRFWDKNADKYSKRSIGDEKSYQKKLDITRDLLSTEMDVFEFGCGTGTTAIKHAPYARHIRAIDFSTQMIEIAQGKAKVLGITNISFEHAEIESMDEIAESYDMVMGHSILHLLEDRQAVISKVYDLLKPGGVFVTSTVCLGFPMTLLKPILTIGRVFGFLPLVRFLSRDELVGEMTKTGFSIEYEWLSGGTPVAFIVARKPK
jgi:ubiquinone/menaquinone biosynthesis C-methylase UbiE